MPRIPLNGQAYEGTSIDVNYQRTVNWYPENDGTGKDKVPLYPTPGFTTAFATAGSGPIRAQIVLNSLLYVVSSDTFYSITTGGSVTNLGTLQTSSGRVEMAHNGDEILIVDGTQGCLYKESTTTFTSDLNSTDADFPKVATSCTFLDGYFVVNDPGNTNAAGAPGAFFISGSYDGTAWSALDYTVAERSWDQIQSLRIANGQLWVIGQNSTEVYANTGNADFPFERISSAVIEFGTIAGASASESDNTVIWLSQSKYGQGQVLQNNGYSVVKISTDALDDAIHGYTKTDALAFTLQWKGHVWYVLTFPTSNKTWVYDLSTKMWFQWSTNGDNARHISNSYAYFNNTHYIGSRSDGDIYALSATEYSDNGTAITRLRQSPHLHFDGKKGFIRALELILEQGVGTVSVTDPQVMLQWSKDRGHTWSSEQWRDILGNVGEYSKASTWRRLGRCEDIIFRIKITDAVKAVLVGAYVDVNLGDYNVT